METQLNNKYVINIAVQFIVMISLALEYIRQSHIEGPPKQCQKTITTAFKLIAIGTIKICFVTRCTIMNSPLCLIDRIALSTLKNSITVCTFSTMR